MAERSEVEAWFLDHGLPYFVAEERAELSDALLQVVVLILDTLALETGQGPQAKFEDRGGLNLGKAEPLHELCARVVGILGCADEGDDLVEVIECDQVARKDVGALLCLA